MNANSTASVVVEPGGEQVVAHVGLHALGALGDRLGLGAALSARIAATGERRMLHDRGKVLVQSMFMLAGGGECCGDIEHLRAQDLFGQVPSDSTVYRTFRRIGPTGRDTLCSIGVGSMTISTVEGFGNQRGHREAYRGRIARFDAQPRVRVDVVVSDGVVPDVVDHIVGAAETEFVGDGKVWVVPMTDLVRIRTGESGVDAL